jgi:hypothetical protein
VWDRVLKALQSQKDQHGELDWGVHYLDATIVRAHQHAAGAKGGPKEGGARLLSGRFFHQDTPKNGRVWQAYGLLG